MREIQQVIEQAARADVTVLVCGETGVGKELVARAIHTHSPRRRAAFIKVNCAAMPRELLESELFGHERGAFTGAHQRKPGRFELADGGTIFLDEIGELHPALQAKLLHVLQDGEFSRVGGRHNIRVDVRVDLRHQPRPRARGGGRPLPRGPLLPPERHQHPGAAAARAARGDPRPRRRTSSQRYSRVFNVAERELGPDAMQAFLAYHWPGNIRELENFIKRMIVLQDWTLARTLVAPAGRPAAGSRRRSRSPPPSGLSLKEISRRAVLEAEREVIGRALEQCRWNRVKTAKMLRISYRALLYKIKDMGLKQDPAAS